MTARGALPHILDKSGQAENEYCPLTSRQALYPESSGQIVGKTVQVTGTQPDFQNASWVYAQKRAAEAIRK